MAKRFTDTEKWKDSWFCGLSTPEKMFWVYICDTCSLSGFWQINWPLVKFYIPDFEYREEVFRDRITVLKGKWHIKKFTDFQYGVLQPEKNRLHNRISFELQKEGVSTPLPRGVNTLKDKDKDKELDKDKKKAKPTLEEVRAYCAERRNKVDPAKFFHFYESKGWMVGKNPMKNWKSAVVTWESDGKNQNSEEVIG